MMRFFFILFLFVSQCYAQIAETTCNPTDRLQTPILYWMYSEGDNPQWASSDFNDSNWILIERDQFYTEKKGIYWLRTKIIFPEKFKEVPIILRLGRIQSAFEVYWNGTLIGSNGKVGKSEAEEIPGKLFYAESIDTLVRAGDNSLAVRFSNYHVTPPGFFFYARIDCDLESNFYAYKKLLRITFNIGVLLTGIAVGLALFFSGQRYKNYFFYFLLCLAMLISYGFQFIMHYYNISMGVLQVFEPIYVGGFYLTEVAIAFFIIFSFNLSCKKFHVPFIIIFTIPFYAASFSYSTVLYLNYSHYGPIIFIYVFSLIIYAIIKRKKGSIIALIGYVFFGFFRFGISDLPIFSWFPGDYYLPLLSLIYIMVANRQVHEQQEIQKAIELRAQRLETELLKKTIQPHFIINTLASIKSLAKRKPEKAEELITALAGEFRLMNKISSEKEIPLSQEIELCEYHLKVMGFRWEAEYELLAQNIDLKKFIPPLIFHTLIENGLTHAFNPKENGTFWLSCSEGKNYYEYILRNNGSLLEKLDENDSYIIEEGTGIKYVKSRLEERYPGKWELNYGMKDSLWEVSIKIYRNT